LMQLAELEAAARLRAPLVVLLVNDSGYGAEMHKLKAKGFDTSLAELVSWPSPDFAALARQFGADGAIIRGVDELADALARGLACGTLFVIDARVSPSEPSDSYRAMHLGEANRAPRLVPVRPVVPGH
jgi:acetolactate synthase I/II/III large subunit